MCFVWSESKKKLKRPTIFTISSCRRHYHVMRILQTISQKVCRYRDTGNRSSLLHCVCTLTIYGRRKFKFVGSASHCCNSRCFGTSQAHRQKNVATYQLLSCLAGNQISWLQNWTFRQQTHWPLTNQVVGSYWQQQGRTCSMLPDNDNDK